MAVCKVFFFFLHISVEKKNQPTNIRFRTRSVLFIFKPKNAHSNKNRWCLCINIWCWRTFISPLITDLHLHAKQINSRLSAATNQPKKQKKQQEIETLPIKCMRWLVFSWTNVFCQQRINRTKCITCTQFYNINKYKYMPMLSRNLGKN